MLKISYCLTEHKTDTFCISLQISQRAKFWSLCEVRVHRLCRIVCSNWRKKCKGGVSQPHQQTWCFIKIFIPYMLLPVVFLDLAVTFVQTIVLKVQYCLPARAVFKAQANKLQHFHSCSINWAVPRIYNCSLGQLRTGELDGVSCKKERRKKPPFRASVALYLPHILYLCWHLPVLPHPTAVCHFKVSRTRVEEMISPQWSSSIEGCFSLLWCITTVK